MQNFRRKFIIWAITDLGEPDPMHQQYQPVPALIFLALEVISNCTRQKQGETLLYHYVHQTFNCCLWVAELLSTSLYCSALSNRSAHILFRERQQLGKCFLILLIKISFLSCFSSFHTIPTLSEVDVSNLVPPWKPELWCPFRMWLLPKVLHPVGCLPNSPALPLCAAIGITTAGVLQTLSGSPSPSEGFWKPHH